MEFLFSLAAKVVIGPLLTAISSQISEAIHENAKQKLADIAFQMLQQSAQGFMERDNNWKQQIVSNGKQVILNCLQTINNQLENDVNAIKKDLTKLKDVKFKRAIQTFDEALRWYHRKDGIPTFKENIILTFDLCSEACFLTNVDDILYCYSIYICCAFLKRSNFGENLAHGLYGVVDVLRSLNRNHSDTIRQIMREFKSNLIVASKTQCLAEQILRFSLNVEKLVKNVQYMLITTNGIEVCVDPMDEKTAEKLNQILNLNSNNRIEVEAETMCENWIPNVLNGYYLGNTEMQSSMSQIKKRVILKTLSYGDITLNECKIICKELNKNDIFLVGDSGIKFQLSNNNNHLLFFDWDQCLQLIKSFRFVVSIEIILLIRFYKFLKKNFKSVKASDNNNHKEQKETELERLKINMVVNAIQTIKKHFLLSNEDAIKEYEKDFVVGINKHLTAKPYDEIKKRGGVIRMKIKGKLILQENSSIDVSGLGCDDGIHDSQQNNLNFGESDLLNIFLQSQTEQTENKNNNGDLESKLEMNNIKREAPGARGGNGGVICIQCDELIMKENSSIIANGINSKGCGGRGGIILFVVEKIILHKNAKIEAKKGVGHKKNGLDGQITVFLKNKDGFVFEEYNFNPQPNLYC